MKNDKNNSLFILIVLFIGTTSVFFFPKIYDTLNTKSVPHIKLEKEEEIKEEKKITDELLEVVHFPKMRTSKYSDFTYYSLDKFKISDMTNNDILYNAFLDIYEKNIVASNYYGECTNEYKEFKPSYIEARVNNILGEKVQYNLEDFNVPVDSTSNYKGIWHYNGSVYYYGGLCNSQDTSIEYYDLERQIDAKFDNDDLVITYYVAFAKVIGNDYVIYSDANMEKEIEHGSGDVQDAFKSIDAKHLRKYEYRFRDPLCSYEDYCLYEGKWLNE